MKLTEYVDKSWYPVLTRRYQEPLRTLLEDTLPNQSFQPLAEDVFRVFEMPLNKIRIVILGTEPSPIPGESIGLSYAVNPLYKLSNSLKAIQHEIGITDIDPTLDHWTKQGIFLLNTSLTVQTGHAGSHNKYWEEFIQYVISYISTKNPCLWFLWGDRTQKFSPYIKKSCPFQVEGYDRTTITKIPANKNWNYIFKTPHPATEMIGKSGFYGSDVFGLANQLLNKLKLKTIKF